MKLRSMRVCKDASVRLSQLKARTGLTPNILCRIGFCLSINDPSVPNPKDYPPDSERDIDRHTLTGPWDDLFVALIKERCKTDDLQLTDKILTDYFRAHVNRGVILLHKRTRTLTDFAHLLPRDLQEGGQRDGNSLNRHLAEVS